MRSKIFILILLMFASAAAFAEDFRHHDISLQGGMAYAKGDLEDAGHDNTRRVNIFYSLPVWKMLNFDMSLGHEEFSYDCGGCIFEEKLKATDLMAGVSASAKIEALSGKTPAYVLAGAGGVLTQYRYSSDFDGADYYSGTAYGYGAAVYAGFRKHVSKRIFVGLFADYRLNIADLDTRTPADNSVSSETYRFHVPSARLEIGLSW